MKIRSAISAANIYLLLVAVLLAVTAGAKLYSAAGEARILAVPDPLLQLSNREVLIGVGLLELAVAAFLLLGRHKILPVIGLVRTHRLAPHPRMSCCYGGDVRLRHHRRLVPAQDHDELDYEPTQPHATRDAVWRIHTENEETCVNANRRPLFRKFLECTVVMF